MKISLLYIGKTGSDFLKEGEKEYTKRLKKYVNFEVIELPDVKNTKNRQEEEIKQLEEKKILDKLKETDFVVLLDEKGKEYTSVEFSDFLQKQFYGSSKRLVFIIGGPYGFSTKIYERGDFKLALSQLTFSHQMIRMFFIEQLYRAMTILNNEPYHHQ